MRIGLNQKTGLGTRGPLEPVNDTKLVLNNYEVTHAHLETIWYHPEPFAVPYNKPALVIAHIFFVSLDRVALSACVDHWHS